jgi:hypothetical protein
VTGGGPEGRQGIVCAQSDSYQDGRNVFHREMQRWTKVPGADCWVGYWIDAVPGPADLARRKQIAGYGLVLGDGRSWEIPVARSYAERGEGEAAELFYEVNLPRALELAADGKWTAGGVVARYAPLWELAEAWPDRCRGVLPAGELSPRPRRGLPRRPRAADRRPRDADPRSADRRADGDGVLQKKSGEAGGEDIDRGRWLRFIRWARGRDPHYRPTIADLIGLAAGLADEPPVTVQQLVVPRSNS